jgi:hypothetical protein
MGYEPTKFLILGEDRYLKTTLKRLTKIVDFVNRYPKAAKVIKISSKLGLMAQKLFYKIF